jgi:hypothetical protein
MTNPQAAANTPRTAAGRDFVQSLADYEGAYIFGHDYEVEVDSVRSAVCRIEAEAIKPWVKKYEGMRKERDLEVHKKRTARRTLTERAEAAAPAGSFQERAVAYADGVEAIFGPPAEAPEPEGLDVDVLAEALHRLVVKDYQWWEWRDEGKTAARVCVGQSPEFAQVLAAEYNRLAAARPGAAQEDERP